MSLRLNSAICILCFAVAAYALYMVKFSVQNLQHEVVQAKSQLAQEKESLHLLKAEWAYLNRPDRLRHLSDAHLPMVPLDSRKMDNVESIPTAAPEQQNMLSPNISAAVYQQTSLSR